MPEIASDNITIKEPFVEYSKYGDQKTTITSVLGLNNFDPRNPKFGGDPEIADTILKLNSALFIQPYEISQNVNDQEKIKTKFMFTHVLVNAEKKNDNCYLLPDGKVITTNDYTEVVLVESNKDLVETIAHLSNDAKVTDINIETMYDELQEVASHFSPDEPTA